YWPSTERFVRLSDDGLKRAAALAKWRRKLQQGWQRIRVEGVETTGTDPLQVGAEMRVKARVNLGNFAPEDVEVQLFHRVVDNQREIPNPRTLPMSHNGAHDGSTWLFSGTLACRTSGQHGYAVRVLPRHSDLANPFEPGLVCWG